MSDKDRPGLRVAEKQEKSNLSEWWDSDGGVTDLEILERRRKVAVHWNQLGHTLAVTAKTLGVSTNTIASDRRWLLDRWQDSVQADVVDIVAREVAKLDVQESELWKAWEMSKKSQVETHKEKEENHARRGDTTINRRITRTRIPEARFMELIIKCQERRAKLLGLDKAVTYDGASFSFAMFVEEAHDRGVERRDRKPDQIECDQMLLTSARERKRMESENANIHEETT